MAKKAKAVPTSAPVAPAVQAVQQPLYNLSLARELATYARNDEGMYVPEQEATALKQLMHNGQPCFTVDFDDRDEDDNSLVFIVGTAAAIEMFSTVPQSISQPAPLPTPEVSKPVFVIEEGYVPAKRATPTWLAPRESIYPWDEIKVGQSFFVPTHINSKGKPSSVASAVSAQNRKINDSGVKDRTFLVRNETHPGTGAAGERVYCIAYREPRIRTKKAAPVA